MLKKNYSNLLCPTKVIFLESVMWIRPAGTNCVFLLSPPQAFVEVYNMTTDPHQLENIVKKVDPALLQVMNQRLIKLQSCKGDSCRKF